MSDLQQKHCVSCEGGVAPLDKVSAEALRKQTPQWKLIDNDTQIERTFTFASFQPAIDFINQVAKIAEAENHHPDIHLERFKRVSVVLSTHAISGLSENDFILAAKIDALS